MTFPAEYDALLTLCAARRSVREFCAQPLTPEQIAAIRAIALTAPYASGKKNWELRVVTERALIEALAKIVQWRSAQLGTQVRDDFRELFLDYAVHFTAFASAPALFIPVYKVQPSLSLMLAGGDMEVAQWERDNFVKSISGVVMLIQLAAQSLGLGACCMTGPLLAEAELAQKLGLKPGFEIGAMIPVGYPQGDE